jgi:hypothetical protein
MSEDARRCASRAYAFLCWFQGTYYLATGLWPLVSIRTFKMVTGEKTDNLPSGKDADHWLVMTVGTLITSVAITLLSAAFRRTQIAEVTILAVGAAVGLTAIDLIYTARGVIAPIYLLDAAIEVPLILAWIVVSCQRTGGHSHNACRLSP